MVRFLLGWGGLWIKLWKTCGQVAKLDFVKMSILGYNKRLYFYKRAIMAVLPILHYPNPRLRIVAEEVGEINDEIKTLIADMFETMYDAKGIGLAATQVDRHVQVVVMDLAKEGEEPQPKVYINPKVTPLTEELVPYKEGCLSIPEVYDEVNRPARVQIEARDAEGVPFSVEADGLLAVCIQHELDHLKGIVFVDYLSRLKQDRAREKVRKVMGKKGVI